MPVHAPMSRFGVGATPMPAVVHFMAGPLPRNPNGKIDSEELSTERHEQQAARCCNPAGRVE